jgi:hypothetical protein
MTRIKQFANDMGLSYNQAKGLVEKGRKKKDGGSTVLEKFMPGTAKVIKKQSGGGFDDDFKALQALNREFEKAKQKPESQKRKESLQREIKKAPDKSTKSFFTRELKAGGKKGINRNLLDDKFLTDEELKKKYPKTKSKQKSTMTKKQLIDDLVYGGDKPKKPRVGAGTPKMRKSMPRGDITKKMKNGGSNKVLKPIPPDNKGLQALKKERPDVVASMGFKKKGGVLSFDMGGMNDMEDGTYMAKIESLQIVPTEKKTMGSPGPRPTPKRAEKRGPARGGPVPRRRKGMKQSSMKRPRRMMGGGMNDMNPKRMSGGGVARGTGAAVKGTGFKGVY